MIMPDGCSLPDGSGKSRRNLDRSATRVYRKLIAAKTFEPHWFSADNVESARRAHHLQNPQNRPWYRFCNRLADRPLGGMGGEWDF
jgi:hypothetical protein